MNNTGKKFGGRSKGTPNKQTNEIRTFLSKIIANNLENMESDLKELSSKDRLNILVQILKYVTPQYKSVEIIEDHETNPFEPLVINFEFGDESKKY